MHLRLVFTLLLSITVGVSLLTSPPVTVGATNPIATNTCGTGYFQFMSVSGWYAGSRLCVATSTKAIVTSCPSGSSQRPYYVNPAFETGKTARTERIRIYRWIMDLPSDLSVQFQTSKGIAITSTASAFFYFASASKRFTSTQLFPTITYSGGGTRPGEKAQAVAISLWENRWVYDWQKICVARGKPVAVLTNSSWRSPRGLAPIWKSEVGNVNQAVRASLRYEVVRSSETTPTCPTSSNMPDDRYFLTIPPKGSIQITTETDVSWGAQFSASYGQAQFGLAQSSSRSQTLTVTFTNSSEYGRRLCVDPSAAAGGNFQNGIGTGEKRGTTQTPAPGLIIGVATSN